MATVTQIAHYAQYTRNGQDVYGIARLVGGGYYFTPERGESFLVSYKDVELVLCGRCDLVAQADAADGDRVKTCSRTLAA